MAGSSPPPAEPGALSPVLSSNASVTDLSNAFPPRSSSARPFPRRRGSNTSSVVSFSSIGTATMDWRASKDFVGGSSTAISALLESPNARTTTASRPRPGEIPPVTLTQIPKIKPSVFAPYLAIAKDYDRYQRAKDQGLEDHVRLSRNDDSDSLSPAPSIAGYVLSDDGISKGGSPKRGRGRKGTLAMTPLSTVPQVYFDEAFRLENPRTFDVVSERSEIIRSAASTKDEDTESVVGQSQRKALTTNAILQEKLSWYMDTVEVHLIKSISTASSSFFAALGDLRELHSEAASSVKKIQGLRKELVHLDEEQAVKGLEIVRLRRRRDNVAKLERAAKQMERVITCVQKAEESLEEREIGPALDLVQETESLISGTGEDGLIDLTGVNALQAVVVDLNHLRYRIGTQYEARFVERLLSDLRRHIKAVPSSETLRRFAQSFQREQYQRFIQSKQQHNLQPPLRSSSLPPEYSLLSEDLRAFLMDNLDGLQRANYITNAMQAYRDAVMKESKNLVRQNLPSDDDADSVASGMSRVSRSGGPRSSADKSMALTRALRALGPIDAEDMFVRIYTSASELIRRLGTQQKLLLDVTMQMGEVGVGGMLSPRLFDQGNTPTPSNSLGPDGSSDGRRRSGSDVVAAGIQDLISSAVEIAQANIVKVVKVRTEQVARYPPDSFVRYFTLNRLFAQECEAVSMRVNSGLQNAVTGQTRDFLAAYQSERMAKLAESLDGDKWAAKELEQAQQDSVDRILQAAAHEPDEWLTTARLWETQQLVQRNGDSSVTPAANGQQPEEPKKLTHVLVEDQKFILPQSGLLVLSELENYLKLVTTLPSFTSEISNYIVDFLKLFNSRTFQLILGAGATKSAAKLESITTKHLAIASQALSIIITLIPYLRETVHHHHPASSNSTITTAFDNLKRNTQEYQSEIHDKLVSIMADRAKRHVKTMKETIDWDAEQAPGKYYMDVLCRETAVLHRVLMKHWPVELVLQIMTPVFRNYCNALAEGFGDAVVRTEKGRERMIKDATTFKNKLASLEGAGNVPEIVLEGAKNKVVGNANGRANGATPQQPQRTEPAGSPSPERGAGSPASAQEDKSVNGNGSAPG